MNTMVEERDLIARAKHDPEAFGQLYECYVDRIYNYHYRHTGSPIEAEDLTSRTFYRALRSISRYRDQKGASFQSWLFRIAHNLVVNWYRDNSRWQDVSVDNIAPLHSGAPNPEVNAESAEEQRFLLQIIEHLPEDRKTLLVLKFVEQMSNAEIAEILGRTEGAVKSLYHRTLLHLRKTMSGKTGRSLE
jgi:RNA polymerase sigma-70 factor (ECF subfamily)